MSVIYNHEVMISKHVVTQQNMLRLGHACCCGCCLVALSCLTVCEPIDWRPPASSVHGVSPGKNTGVGCHALLLQGIPQPRSQKWILYHLRHSFEII